MESESVRILSAKVAPEAPTSDPTINATEDAEESAINWHDYGRFLLSVVISVPLWGCGTHTASFAVEYGWGPVFLAWLCGMTSVLATVLCRMVMWGRGEQRNRFVICTNPDQEVVAVICCMAGVVMMSHAERPEEEPRNGQILTLSAAAVTASNEVLFRFLIGRLNWQDSAVFLGLFSLCSGLFLWWVPLLVYLRQNVKFPEPSEAPSMEYLCATVVIFFLIQCMEKIGTQCLPTSGVSLGVYLSVAVTAAIDHQWEMPSTWKLMGISAIGFGTVLVIVPENWQEYLGLELSEQVHPEDISDETERKSSLSTI